jgi:transposase
VLGLTERPRQHEANERLAKHLYQHAGQWFVFLLDPEVPATNHRAEQALKTPIVNRKVWGGNRTAAGGEAQVVLSSVLEKCKRRTIDVVHYFSNGLCGVVGALFASPAEQR